MPTTDLDAYDLYLRGLATFFPVTRERVTEALGLLEQAIAIDRHYGPALAWAAVCHMRLAERAVSAACKAGSMTPATLEATLS